MTSAGPDIGEMWQTHLDRRLPPRLRGAEVAGIDLILLDADTAGCVSTWLTRGGRLDPRRVQILGRCVGHLDAALAVFPDGVENDYLRHLRDMAAAVLAETGRADRG